MDRRESREPRVLFRVDGGRIWGVSLGHVFRCLALAGELRERQGAHVAFLMRDYEAGVRLVASRGFDVQTIDREAGWEQEAAIIEGRPEEVVVFDLVDVAGKDTGRLMDRGKRIVVIDDTGNKRIEAHAVVNGSIVPEFLRYPESGRDTRYYLGPRYCILGEEFDDPPYREVQAEVGTILVSMGGSDPAGLTWKVARMLGRSLYTCNLVVVLGPGFEGRAAVESALRSYGGNCVVIENPSALASLMQSADLMILAGGRTAYEAARLGVPGVIIPSAEHEERVAEAFAREGTFLFLPQGWRLPEEEFERRLAPILDRLLNDRSLRARMSERGSSLVDGRGRRRVARLLVEREEPLPVQC
ncbi:MAG: hypothetical protein GXP39_11390 [Chloroflexi bacterium]|nr:hypothetical protein [Chloroflexota bacterium]